MINQSVTHGGVTLNLKSAILNGDELLINVVSTKTEETIGELEAPAGFVYINGEEINGGALMEFNSINENTGHTLIKLPLLKEYSGVLDIKVKLTSPLSTLERSPHWVFAFRADDHELKLQTIEVDLGHTVKITDDNYVTLTKYRENDVNITTNFTLQKSLDGVGLVLKGVNEDNQEVIMLGRLNCYKKKLKQRDKVRKEYYVKR